MTQPKATVFAHNRSPEWEYLFTRLLNNHVIEKAEEKELLSELALRFDRSVPKYSCPWCWLLRILSNKE
jgi:hypothetical protein